MGRDHLGHVLPVVGEGTAEVRGDGEVPRLALVAAQQVVGHRSQKRLGEGVLAAVRRELIRAHHEHLLAHERREQRIDALVR